MCNLKTYFTVTAKSLEKKCYVFSLCYREKSAWVFLHCSSLSQRWQKFEAGRRPCSEQRPSEESPSCGLRNPGRSWSSPSWRPELMSRYRAKAASEPEPSRRWGGTKKFRLRRTRSPDQSQSFLIQDERLNRSFKSHVSKGAEPNSLKISYRVWHLTTNIL